jgi:hypothetical protein
VTLGTQWVRPSTPRPVVQDWCSELFGRPPCQAALLRLAELGDVRSDRHDVRVAAVVPVVTVGEADTQSNERRRAFLLGNLA